MGVRLMAILDQMPVDATLGDRLVMFLLAEQARDDTLLCWPGAKLLTRRSGMEPSSVRRVIGRLVRFGLLERVAAGTDLRGATIYAYSGRRATYKIIMPPKAIPSDTRSGSEGDPLGHTSAPEGDHPGTDRESDESAITGEWVSERIPLPSGLPVRDPSAARASAEHIAVVREVVHDRTGERITDEHAAAVARDLLDGRDVRSPIAYLRAAVARDPARFVSSSRRSASADAPEPDDAAVAAESCWYCEAQPHALCKEPGTGRTINYFHKHRKRTAADRSGTGAAAS